MAYKNTADELAASRAYYAAHREVLLVKQRARYRRNKAAYQAAKAVRNQDPLVRAQRRARDRASYAKNPQRMRVDQLRIKYGLTIVAYDALVASQGGRCAACARIPTGPKSKHRTLHVDHDHRTGRVRGLLCDKCNRGIGLMGDDAETLRRAANYLDRYANHRHTA